MNSMPKPVVTIILISLVLSNSVEGQSTGQAPSSDPVKPLLDPIYAYHYLMTTSILLGVATVAFIWLVHRGAGDKFAMYFGGGQLVQFVVILLIANNVLHLALLGVLRASEVSAIYGGIVGYVLGRRTQPPSQPLANPSQPSVNPGDGRETPDAEH